MANLVRISIRGTMPGGEAWSINPVFGITAPGASLGDTGAQACAEACAGTTVPADLKTVNVSGVTIASFRAEARLWDGTLEGVGEFALTTPVAGTASSNVLPYQSTMVISLNTAHAGATGKGRVYYPVTSAPLSASTLRISSSTTTTFLNAFKTYLGGMQTAMRTAVSDPSAGWIVWSRKNAAGYFVNNLAIGDIMDVQRRRRDALVENYTSVTFP